MDDCYSAIVDNHGCALLPRYEQPNMANLVHPNLRILRPWRARFLQLHKGAVKPVRVSARVPLASQGRSGIVNESVVLLHRGPHQNGAESLTARARAGFDTMASPPG